MGRAAGHSRETGLDGSGYQAANTNLSHRDQYLDKLIDKPKTMAMLHEKHETLLDYNAPRGDAGPFTIRWTKPDGATQYPINPGPISREIADAWAKHGEVDGWKGEVIPWDEYLRREV